MKAGENINFQGVYQAEGLRLEIRSTDPSSPLQGHVYFNDALRKIRVFNGDSWDNYAVGELLRFLGKVGADVSTAPSNSYGLVYNFNATENLVAGEVCYHGATGMTKANANAQATSKGLLGICMSAVTAGNSGLFLLKGYIQAGSGLTNGNPIWLSTTSGVFTESAPTGSGHVKKIIGYAISSNEIWFDPDKTYIVNS